MNATPLATLLVLALAGAAPAQDATSREDRAAREIADLRGSVRDLSAAVQDLSARFDRASTELKVLERMERTIQKLADELAALKAEQKELALTVRTAELDHREFTLRLREMDQLRRDEARGETVPPRVRPRPEEPGERTPESRRPAPERRPPKEERPLRPKAEGDGAEGAAPEKKPAPPPEAPPAAQPPPKPAPHGPVPPEVLALLEDAQRLFYADKDYSKARDALDRLLAGNPGGAVRTQVLYLRGLCHHRLKDYRKAISDFSEGLASTGPGETRGMLYYNIACGHALLGERDRAMENLLKAFDEKFDDPGFRHTRADPDLEGLRGDPRFKELVEGSKKP